MNNKIIMFNKASRIEYKLRRRKGTNMTISDVIYAFQMNYAKQRKSHFLLLFKSMMKCFIAKIKFLRYTPFKNQFKNT